MKVLLALTPCLAVFFTIFVLRFNGLLAAASATLASLLLWVSSAFGPGSAAGLGRALLDMLLLMLIVASVLVPGLFFVEVTRRRGAPLAVATLVHSLKLPVQRATILITIGVGVFVESLTGMGVSLLVTMPLLLEQVPRRQAIGLGLVGMGLMPWGALALPSVLGAKLSGISETDFGQAAWLLSAPWALLLPTLASLIAHQAGETRFRSGLAAAIGIGLLLTSVMGVATWAAGIEVAGVLGGSAVILTLTLFNNSTDFAGRTKLPSGVWPYAVLVILVVVQKPLFAALSARNLAPHLSTDRLSWSVLSTPGLALCATAVATSVHVFDRTLFTSVATRIWRPLLATALFLLSARLLIEIGGTTALANAAADLPEELALLGVGLLGAISGFLTGSGISGNALFMPSAAKIGAGFGHSILFSAMQNAAAAHAALASLPIAAVLLAALTGKRTAEDDRTALTYGLWISGLSVGILMLWSLILLYSPFGLKG